MKDFEAFLRGPCRVGPSDGILLACSGGIDSTCLAHLLHRIAQPFEIAHLNHGLRGADADSDADFVRDLAGQLGVAFHERSLDLHAQKTEGGSVQTLSRELRYTWLETLRSEIGLAAVATGHQLDDQAETMLYNTGRGTGLAGLHGIAPRRGHLVRPLLGYTRAEIETWAHDRGISWREDASNSKTDYARNFLRHEVLAPWLQREAHLPRRFGETANRIREQESLYRLGFETILRRISSWKDDALLIGIRALLDSPAPKTTLHELLRPLGFSDGQLDDILQAVGKPVGKQGAARSGRQFVAPGHRLVVDRKHLILVLARDDEAETVGPVYLDPGRERARLGLERLRVYSESRKPGPVNERPRGLGEALFDLDRLDFPLTWRRWRAGDFLYPIGLTRRQRDDRPGRKKVSDLLTDNKLPLPQKERVSVLVSGDRLVWVVGHRADERFKLRESTTRVLRVKVVSKPR